MLWKRGNDDCIETFQAICACGDFVWDDFEGKFENLKNPKDEEQAKIIAETRVN